MKVERREEIKGRRGEGKAGGKGREGEKRRRGGRELREVRDGIGIGAEAILPERRKSPKTHL